ncbi:MAG: flagellin [Bdellovibrio sp.]
MGMRIATNVSSLNAQRTLTTSQRNINKSNSQLSSGNRINSASDDAAGLAISEGLKSQIRSLGQASRNALDGMSLIQVAEGGLGEISNILTRMRELGIQASSDTLGERERGYINLEIQQLKSESERIARTTRFGTQSLLDGEGRTYEIQVGTNNDEFQDRISFDASDINATVSSLGVEGLAFDSKEGAQESIMVLDEAQNRVNSFRANLGALQNRFESTTANLAVQNENISAANSRIRDADIAASSGEAARNNILLQASTSVLAQANQQPALALKMLS